MKRKPKTPLFNSLDTFEEYLNQGYEQSNQLKLTITKLSQSYNQNRSAIFLENYIKEN